MSILTPYEATGNTVDLATERNWHDTLVSDSGRVVKVVLGNSQDGHPLHLLGVGGTAPPAWPPSATTGGLVVVGAQHSIHESASREAVAAFARDCAYDSGLVSELDARPLWIFPNWNPDRYERTLVNGVDGDLPELYQRLSWFSNAVNPNRDSLKGAAPETLLYFAALRAIDPLMIVDVHEHGTGGLQEPTEIGSAPPRSSIGTYTNGGMADQGTAAANSIIASLIGLGYSSRYYPHTLDPEPLTVWAGMAGIVGVLIETDGGNAGPLADRVARSTLTQHLAFDWFRANRAELAATQSADHAAVVAKGQTGGVWSVSNTTTATVAGYSLTSAQWAVASPIITAHGISSVVDEGDATSRYVGLDQKLGRVIVRMLDPSSPERVTSAGRMVEHPEWYSPFSATNRRRGASVVGLI